MHKKIWIIHNHSFYTKIIYTWFNVLMKVNSFVFIQLCWNFPNQTTSYNAIDIFENLTMNRGALTWVESFWNYNAKVIDYWTIFKIKFNKIINRNFYSNPKVYLALLESNRWVKFNEIYFTIFILKVWKILNFEWILLLKIQTNCNKLGLERKMTWACSHLGPTTHVTLFIHDGR